MKAVRQSFYDFLNGAHAPPVVHAHHEEIEMTFPDGKVVIVTGTGRGLGAATAGVARDASDARKPGR